MCIRDRGTIVKKKELIFVGNPTIFREFLSLHWYLGSSPVLHWLKEPPPGTQKVLQYVRGRVYHLFDAMVCEGHCVRYDYNSPYP